MEEEKRKAIRIEKSLVALYSKDEKTWDMTHVRNISETGMQLTTMYSLSQDENLIFLVKIPFQPFEWIELQGKVVESTELKTVFEESVAGTQVTRIKFVNLKEEQKNLIREYVDWFLEKEGL
ncbi:MAG: PilZ domain-containing protein [Candidatus Omnitrophota bacterium]